MNNNELLRSLRKLLAANETGMAEIFAHAGISLTPEQAHALLRHDNEDGFQPCSDLQLAHFIEGLIISRRGPKQGADPAPVSALDNNQILKKLRVAFELQDADMHAIFVSAGHELSKQELSALFRKPGHKNFQPCSDQLLRGFIKGLTTRARPR